mmetsp:Transcript_28179/g.45285  ORF Transcript_28179/g.45285 Transcript_28179/m.45285 type:complete len:220 (-) Transcript_28179:264-923(-)
MKEIWESVTPSVLDFHHIVSRLTILFSFVRSCKFVHPIPKIVNFTWPEVETLVFFVSLSIEGLLWTVSICHFSKLDTRNANNPPRDKYSFHILNRSQHFFSGKEMDHLRQQYTRYRFITKRYFIWEFAFHNSHKTLNILVGCLALYNLQVLSFKVHCNHRDTLFRCREGVYTKRTANIKHWMFTIECAYPLIVKYIRATKLESHSIQSPDCLVLIYDRI